jgi:hypothetical protein
MSDPVAAKSTFLCMYMSNHPDTLVSYVRYWGKVKQHVSSAQMTGIDTKVPAPSHPLWCFGTRPTSRCVYLV